MQLYDIDKHIEPGSKNINLHINADHAQACAPTLYATKYQLAPWDLP